MANPPTASNSGWKIEYQQPTVEVDGSGKPVSGMRVAFVTGKGVHAWVFVPQNQYSVDNVRALVSARVAEIDAVHALTG